VQLCGCVAILDRRGMLWCALRLTKRLGCWFLGSNGGLPHNVHHGSRGNHCHVSQTSAMPRSTGDARESFASHSSSLIGSPMLASRRPLSSSVSAWMAYAGVADTKHRARWLLGPRGDGIHRMDPNPHSPTFLRPSLHLHSLILGSQILTIDHHKGFSPPTLPPPHQG
jgi:hypothetical protein